MKLLSYKFFLIVIYLISTIISFSDEPDIKNLVIHKQNKKLENIIFTDVDNKSVNLKEFSSQLVIINFWATWCAPCREEMPSLNNLQKLKGEKKIMIIPINIGGENISTSKRFFDDLLIEELQVFVGDGAGIAKNLKLRGLPTTLFIDKDGYEFARIVGSIDFNSDEFLNWLNELN